VDIDEIKDVVHLEEQSEILDGLHCCIADFTLEGKIHDRNVIDLVWSHRYYF
jgi:hypothetical protein